MFHILLINSKNELNAKSHIKSITAYLAKGIFDNYACSLIVYIFKGY